MHRLKLRPSYKQRIYKGICAFCVLLAISLVASGQFQANGLSSVGAAGAEADGKPEASITETSDSFPTVLPEQSVEATQTTGDMLAVSQTQNTDDFENRRLTSRNTRKEHQEAAADTPGEDEKGHSLSAWRTVLSLVVVLGCILGCSWLLRRYSPMGRRLAAGGGLEVIGRSSLNTRQSLCVVKVGSRLLVVGLSPNHMAALDVITDPDEIARVVGQGETGRSQSISNTFGRLFHGESVQYDPSDPDELESVPDKTGRVLGQSADVHRARRELAGLLGKVRGLTRLRQHI